MEKQDTKAEILTKGAELVHAQGFNNTGIQEVLQAAGVPKGSFYFYFKNKEDFGLQLVDYHVGNFRALAEKTLLNASLPPLERIRSYFRFMGDLSRGRGYRCGCPIGNLIQEMSDLSPAFQEKLRHVIEGSQKALALVLAEARDAGDIPASRDPREVAVYLINAWQGAVMHSKLVKSGEPLELFEKLALDTLPHDTAITA